jgi:hypothetical protein
MPFIINSEIKNEGLFLILSGVTFFSMIMLAFYLKETKGIAKDKLEILFSN